MKSQPWLFYLNKLLWNFPSECSKPSWTHPICHCLLDMLLILSQEKWHGRPEVSIYLAVFIKNVFLDKLQIFWHPSDQTRDFIWQSRSWHITAYLCVTLATVWLVGLESVSWGSYRSGNTVAQWPSTLPASAGSTHSSYSSAEMLCCSRGDWNGSQPGQCSAEWRKFASSKTSASDSKSWGQALSCRVLNCMVSL